MYFTPLLHFWRKKPGNKLKLVRQTVDTRGMRQYHDPFEQLLAEVVCEVAEELAKPQPQDSLEKNLTFHPRMVVCRKGDTDEND